MLCRAIALAALLACGGTAAAQSNVTLYGVLDTNIEYVNHLSPVAPGTPGFPGESASKVALSSGGLSGSRWGLRGEEDLGAGMRALFVLESGFGVDDGKSQQGGRLFGRQAFVGLQTPYGKLTLGRQYTSLFEALANFSPTAYATQYEPIIFLAGLNFRSDNTIKYTGAFGPVTALAHWSAGNGVFGPGEQPGQFRRDSGYGGALSYASGPFAATVTYDHTNPTLTPFGDPGIGKARKLAVAASYAMGPARLIGGYRWERSSYANDATQVRDNLWWLGLNYQVTPAFGLTAAYYYDDLRTVRPTRTSAATDPANPWQVSLIGTYSLSKRTDLYVTTAYARHAGLNFDTSPIGFANGYFPGRGEKDMLGAAVGLRHKF